MKRIIFENPPKDLFYSLKELGLVTFYDQKDESTHTLKGIPLFKLKTEFSENACWGNFDDIKLSGGDYLLKLYDEEKHAWKSATIDLTDEGIKILKSSNLKGWKVQ